MVACRRGGGSYPYASVDVCWPPRAFEAALEVYNRLQEWVSVDEISSSATPTPTCDPHSAVVPSQPAPERVVASGTAPGPSEYSSMRKRPLSGMAQTSSSPQASIPLKAALVQALDTVKFALKLFGPRRTVVSFNGGKDAVVLLHLFCAVLAGLYAEDEEFRKHGAYIFSEAPVGAAEKTQEDLPADEAAVNHSTCKEEVRSLYLAPRVIFFHSGDEFPAVEDFVAQKARELALDLRTFEGHYHSNIRRCFQSFGHDTPQAVLLGLRSSDPNSESQQLLEPSSSWLKNVCFLRVHPILHWNYGHVWDFIRRFQLPYCQLYDCGYTSLGSTKSTCPNPHLKVPRQTDAKENGTPGIEGNFVTPGARGLQDYHQLCEAGTHFLPAFELADWRLERSGRLDSRRKRRRHQKRKGGSGANVTVGTAPSSLQGASGDPVEVNASNPLPSPCNCETRDENVLSL